MSKIPMISHAKHNYDGKVVMPNEPFEALTADDADELKVIGFASRCEITKGVAGLNYNTRVMVPIRNDHSTGRPVQPAIPQRTPVTKRQRRDIAKPE